MSYRIKCSTLFNITQTGVTSRTKNTDLPHDLWLQQRNTQCNFDTILQVISLRSQPEVVKYPEKTKISNRTVFGKTEQNHCWSFEFEVQHPSVFDIDADKFKGLYMDCDGVPMITNNDHKSDFLSSSAESKNIHFEAI
jgi:hypothetical protein